MGCSCCDTTDKKPKAISVDILNDDAVICYCEGVIQKQIIEAIEKGAKSVKDVSQMTGACKSAQNCETLNPNKRCCAIDIMEVINAYETKRNKE